MKWNLLTRLFVNLNEYDIEPCPERRVIVKAAQEPDKDGDVIGGQKWKTEFTAQGFDAERVISNTPGRRIKTLTAWDVAYLNEYHKNAFTKQPTWKRDMADKLKEEWATVQADGEFPSAETIVKNHTATGQKEPQKGYGLSNVKKYLHAFNDALRREMEESQSK